MDRAAPRRRPVGLSCPAAASDASSDADLGMPFAPAMTALLQAKLEPAVLADAVLSGRRIGGSEAARLRIVDESCPQAELLDRSVGRVSPLAEKDRATYAALKRGLYERVLKVIAAAGASG
jgi:enoyl-CoA hydratase/carnithine racemase